MNQPLYQNDQPLYQNGEDQPQQTFKIDEILNIFDMELLNAQRLTVDETASISQALQMEVHDAIFKTSTNLILVSKFDYDSLMQNPLPKNMEEVYKIESSEFNYYLYVFRIHNVEPLKILLN